MGKAQLQLGFAIVQALRSLNWFDYEMWHISDGLLDSSYEFKVYDKDDNLLLQDEI